MNRIITVMCTIMLIACSMLYAITKVEFTQAEVIELQPGQTFVLKQPPKWEEEVSTTLKFVSLVGLGLVSAGTGTFIGIAAGVTLFAIGLKVRYDV